MWRTNKHALKATLVNISQLNESSMEILTSLLVTICICEFIYTYGCMCVYIYRRMYEYMHV